MGLLTPVAFCCSGSSAPHLAKFETGAMFMKSLVVFHDYGHGVFRHWLRWGFRHVFVAVLHKGYWIVLDGRGGVPVLEVVAGADYDLAEFYRRVHGFTVLGLTAPRQQPRSPLMLGTCVGAAKRILGVHKYWIVTPYQLFRYLKRHGFQN